jgi:hypothetical protein
MLAVAATKGVRESGVARQPRYASDPGATSGPKAPATSRNCSRAASRFAMISAASTTGDVPGSIPLSRSKVSIAGRVL